MKSKAGVLSSRVALKFFHSNSRAIPWRFPLTCRKNWRFWSWLMNCRELRESPSIMGNPSKVFPGGNSVLRWQESFASLSGLGICEWTRASCTCDKFMDRFFGQHFWISVDKLQNVSRPGNGVLSFCQRWGCIPYTYTWWIVILVVIIYHHEVLGIYQNTLS